MSESDCLADLGERWTQALQLFNKSFSMGIAIISA